MERLNRARLNLHPGLVVLARVGAAHMLLELKDQQLLAIDAEGNDYIVADDELVGIPDPLALLEFYRAKSASLEQAFNDLAKPFGETLVEKMDRVWGEATGNVAQSSLTETECAANGYGPVDGQYQAPRCATEVAQDEGPLRAHTRGESAAIQRKVSEALRDVREPGPFGIRLSVHGNVVDIRALGVGGVQHLPPGDYLLQEKSEGGL